jgi:hypothetical protein
MLETVAGPSQSTSRWRSVVARCLIRVSRGSDGVRLRADFVTSEQMPQRQPVVVLCFSAEPCRGANQ